MQNENMILIPLMPNNKQMKVRISLRKNNMIQEQINYSSLINTPVCWNEKPIGFVTDVNEELNYYEVSFFNCKDSYNLFKRNDNKYQISSVNIIKEDTNNAE